jgi:hypothetical protein
MVAKPQSRKSPKEGAIRLFEKNGADYRSAIRFRISSRMRERCR